MKTLTCLLCREDHRLALCKQFISLSLEERINMIKQWGCCYLSKGHIMRECISRKKCNVNEFSLLHHPLLHGAPWIFLPPQSEEPNKSAAANKPATKKNVEFNHNASLMVPIVVEANGIHKRSVGLFDPGSQASLIVDKLAKHLKLGQEGKKKKKSQSSHHHSARSMAMIQ